MTGLKMKTTIARYLPALILTAIAAVQLYNSKVLNLTPWKGGGFGMFSSIQRIEARFLKVHLIDEDEREYPVSVPERFYREAVSIRAMPNEDELAHLAQSLIAPGLSWYRTREKIPPTRAAAILRRRDGKTFSQVASASTIIRPLSKSEGARTDAEPINAQSIRLELWRYTMDLAANRLVASKWMETKEARRTP